MGLPYFFVKETTQKQKITPNSFFSHLPPQPTAHQVSPPPLSHPLTACPVACAAHWRGRTGGRRAGRVRGGGASAPPIRLLAKKTRARPPIPPPLARPRPPRSRLKASDVRSRAQGRLGAGGGQGKRVFRGVGARWAFLFFRANPPCPVRPRPPPAPPRPLPIGRTQCGLGWWGGGERARGRGADAAVWFLWSRALSVALTRLNTHEHDAPIHPPLSAPPPPQHPSTHTHTHTMSRLTILAFVAVLAVSASARGLAGDKGGEAGAHAKPAKQVAAPVAVAEAAPKAPKAPKVKVRARVKGAGDADGRRERR